MVNKQLFIFLTCVAATLAKEKTLPLCPTNIQFFPQTLPMHCRMPRSADYPGSPPETPSGPPDLLPPFYQSPPSDKQPQPLPIPVPPGGPLPFPFPGAPPPGGAMPMPMPMMPMPGPAHKLPVIVMPFYSPDPAFKKDPKGSSKEFGKRPRKPRRRPHHKRRINHRPHYSDTDSSDTDTDSSDTSSDTSSDVSRDNGWWKRAKSSKSGRRSNKQQKKLKKKYKKSNNDLLTPVLQYVTKDGYVIFEKQITKGEAKDWLKVSKDNHNPKEDDTEGANAEKDPKEEDGMYLKEHKSKEEVQEKENDLLDKSTQRAHKKRLQQFQPNNLLNRRRQDES